MSNRFYYEKHNYENFLARLAKTDTSNTVDKIEKDGPYNPITDFMPYNAEYDPDGEIYNAQKEDDYSRKMMNLEYIYNKFGKECIIFLAKSGMIDCYDIPFLESDSPDIEENTEPTRTVFCKLENEIPETCNTDIPHHIHVGKQQLQIIYQDNDAESTLYHLYKNPYDCNLQNQGCEAMSCRECCQQNNFGESISMRVPTKDRQDDQKNWHFTWYGNYERGMYVDANVEFSKEDFEYIRNLYNEYVASRK